jgi:hypothetical protein
MAKTPETQVVMDAEGARIEGLYRDSTGDRAVVVTHPHPLYGGSMHNNVVEAVVQAYQSRGFATLRFNFRGVGRSEGAYSEGIGEQKDVSAALELLASAGKRLIDLAGYSFGAWVNALGAERFAAAGRLIMVSPPVGFIDFSFLRSCDRLRLIVAGDADDIGPPAAVRKMLPGWNPGARFEVVQGADHFYSGKTRELGRIIREFLDQSAHEASERAQGMQGSGREGQATVSMDLPDFGPKRVSPGS